MSIGHMWRRGDAVVWSFKGFAFGACGHLWNGRVANEESFSLQLHHTR